MKYKSSTLILILAVAAVGCNNPKSDAKEVCDCYQHVIDNPKEAELRHPKMSSFKYREITEV